MLEPYKISVIIPIFKTEKYLCKCLDSIIGNTYRNLEIICVNDGSPDNSQLILERYKSIDSRIIVLQQKNRGLSAARNKALDIASGEFIAFVDSDDWVHPNYFKYLVQLQQKTKSDIAICQYKRVATNEPFSELSDAIDESAIKIMSVSEIINTRYYKTYVWGRLYSRHLISNCRFNEKLKVEDICFNFDILFKRKGQIRYSVIDIPLYFYFMNPTSLSSSLTANIIQTQMIWFLNQLHEYDDFVEKIAAIEAMKSFFACRYLYCFENECSPKENAVSISALKKFIQPAWNILRRSKSVPLKQKIQYAILFKFPSIYRAFRVIDDPTLLMWEKLKQKNKSLKIQNT